MLSPFGLLLLWLRSIMSWSVNRTRYVICWPLLLALLGLQGGQLCLLFGELFTQLLADLCIVGLVMLDYGFLTYSPVHTHEVGSQETDSSLLVNCALTLRLGGLDLLDLLKVLTHPSELFEDCVILGIHLAQA